MSNTHAEQRTELIERTSEVVTRAMGLITLMAEGSGIGMLPQDEAERIMTPAVILPARDWKGAMPRITTHSTFLRRRAIQLSPADMRRQPTPETLAMELAGCTGVRIYDRPVLLPVDYLFGEDCSAALTSTIENKQIEVAEARELNASTVHGFPHEDRLDEGYDWPIFEQLPEEALDDRMLNFHSDYLTRTAAYLEEIQGHVERALEARDV